MTLRTCSLQIHGMHCSGCELVIENAVSELPGIIEIKANYLKDEARIRFDDTQSSIATIIARIDKNGYQAGLKIGSGEQNVKYPGNRQLDQPHTTLHKTFKKIVSITLALLGIGFILWLDSWFMDHTDTPQLGKDISYGLLFLIGFLTSFHCVGMCGPLILGYTTKSASNGYKSYSSHLLYGIGKTLSYTLIGALFGALGSIVAFTPYTQGAAGVAAGIFLILFGLHMLEVFPILNHFQFRIPTFLNLSIGKEFRKHRNPFFIGLLNGLMIICGPLQAMYVMAAGTGSGFEGAAILFCFGIGTLPLLMGFGFLTSLLSANLTPKLLKASGVIVIVLGAIMLNRGLAVTGTGVDFNTLIARVSQKLSPAIAESPSCEVTQTIHMEVLKTGYLPNKFTLRKGVPVKWVINGKELTECNRAIVVPQLQLKFDIQPGLQTIEFTAPESGIISWSCWMGMIPGTFIVIDDESTSLQKNQTTENPSEHQSLIDKIQRSIQKLWRQLP